MNYQNNLIKKMKEIYKFVKDDNILLYGYVGSVSKGYADAYSDLDIVCLCKDNPDYNKIEDALKRLSQEVKVFVDGDKKSFHFPYKETTATIMFSTMSEKENAISIFKEKKDIPSLKKIYSLKDYKVLYGNKQLFESLIHEVSFKIPKEEIRKEFTNLYQWVLNNVEGERLDNEIKRKNWISVNYRLNRTLGWIIQLIYTLNGLVFEDARWAYKDIPKMKLKPRDCLKRIEVISKLGTNKKEIDYKIRLLKEFVKDFGNIIKEHV